MVKIFKLDKLVRDKTCQRMLDRGGKVKLCENLDENSVKKYYAKKISEEAAEVFEESQNYTIPAEIQEKKLIEELADLYEILEAFCHLYKISAEQISEIRDEKIKTHGKFDNQVIVKSLEIDTKTPTFEHFENNPKYPEIA